MSGADRVGREDRGMTKTEAMEILGVNTLTRMARVMEWSTSTLSQWEALDFHREREVLLVAAKRAAQAGDESAALALIDRVRTGRPDDDNE